MAANSYIAKPLFISGKLYLMSIISQRPTISDIIKKGGIDHVYDNIPFLMPQDILVYYYIVLYKTIKHTSLRILVSCAKHLQSLLVHNYLQMDLQRHVLTLCICKFHL